MRLSQMTPDWLFQVMWWGAGVGGGGALWYFLSRGSYHATLWTGFVTVVVVSLAICLHLRNDLLRTERQTITSTVLPASEQPVRENSPTKRDTPSNPSLLTVKSITDEINAAPPYQKETIGKNFEGIYVQWEGTIWDVEKPLFSTPESTDVEVKVTPGRSLHQILFTVSTKTYPQFKILKRGDKITVSGTITACSGAGLYVKLDVDNIAFTK